MTALRRSREVEPLLASLTVLVVSGALFAAGWRFRIPWSHDQLLDREWLTSRPLESLLNLHSQPPGLNATLALALSLAKATGTTAESWLLPFQISLSMISAAAFASLSGRLVKSRNLRWMLLALVVLDPILYAATFEAFYPIHELAFLSLAAWFAVRWQETARLPPAVLSAGTTLFLTLFRALFHPIWAAGHLALVVASRRPRRGVLAIAAATLLLALFWPAKNLVRFGFFGSSSWLGWNFAISLPVPRQPAPLPVRVRRLPCDEAAIEASRRAVPPPYSEIPALLEPFKPGGASNWNQWPMIDYCREMGHRATAVILRDPWLLVDRASAHYVAYGTHAGRDRQSGELVPDRPGIAPWNRAYEILVVQGFAAKSSGGRWTGFLFWFPLVAGGALFAALRDLRRGSGSVLPFVLLFDVLFVLALVLAIDGFEGNRMRWSTQPFVLLLATWLIDRRQLRRGEPPHVDHARIARFGTESASAGPPATISSTPDSPESELHPEESE